jgi:hypothetical protein
MYTQAQYEQHDERQTEDHVVLLSHVSWDDYERLLAMRGDHSAPRIAYLEGEVETMSPSQTHVRYQVRHRRVGGGLLPGA